MQLFLLMGAVLLLAALLIAIADRTAGSLTDRLRLLSVTLGLDSGEFTVAELRAKCQESADRLIDLRSTPEDKRPDTWAADVRDASSALVDFDRLEQVATRDSQRAFEQLVWDQAVADAERRAADPNSRGARGPDAAFDGNGPEMRSLGQQFVESDEYESRTGFNVSEVETRNLLTGSSLGTSGSHELALIGQPYLHTPSLRRRRFFVRDLMSSETTNLQVIPYVQELNATTNEAGATTVSEASAKPEVTMEFTPAEAPVRKIAAWVQVTEEAFADAPTLRGYVDARLTYMLMVEEEDQLINGDGTAPNISGILDQTGIQTQAAINDDLAATIGMAAAKVENVDGFIDGVAINPITYWEGTVERHANQMDGGATDRGIPFADAPPGIWGVPAVRTRAVVADSAIVGNWQQGATIFDRMGTTIKSTDSHASLFISNTLVVLAEKRLGLAVWRPDFFVDTTLNFT